MSIAKRGRLYHLRRRVPRRYQGIEPRETVWISLHTDSETIARSKADRAWSQMIEAWEARLAGNSVDAEARYEAARDLARARGFRYLDAGAVAKLPVEDVVERVEAIPAPANQPDTMEAAALLGTVPEPRITVTKALGLYWGLAKEKTLGKSEDQLRRWEAPRKKAVNNFVAVVGNKEIANITRDDMLDFRQHWLDRIEAGEVTANFANKDLIHLGDVLKTVNTMKRLGLALPLGELSFKEGEAWTRPPFSEDWIKSRLLAPSALNGLNGQARALLLGMIKTGYRPSVSAALTAETIRLDCDVPHISIEPEGHALKQFRRNYSDPNRGPTGKGTARYRALKEVCQVCPSKAKYCPNADARKITREEHEDARQVPRDIAKTRQYDISMKLRKKVEMLFAHLKRILGLGRLRLRGPCVANDEFLLAATAKNLRKLAKIFPAPQQTRKA